MLAKVPTAPRDGAGRDLRAGGDEAGAAAVELGVGEGELDAEGRRLGVDAVRAPDGGGELMLLRAPLQGREEAVEIGEQDVGRAGELHGERGVEHVGRGHALVHEARLRPDDLGEMGEEGDDVVLRLALDGVDAIDVEGRRRALLPDLVGGLLRHDPQLGQRRGRVRLDLEPDPGTWFPATRSRSISGAAVARDHGCLPVWPDVRASAGGMRSAVARARAG